MALDQTHFFYADRGPVSVYKFRVGEDPAVYVWFEYGGGEGSLHTTPKEGPFRPEDPLGDAPVADLDTLLVQRGTSKAQWTLDLFAQYGERIRWAYP
jgi:hypothetical protein